MVLETFPGVKVMSFDLCMHEYTVPAYEELKEKYRSPDGNDMIELVCGHSHETLQKFAKKEVRPNEDQSDELATLFSSATNAITLNHHSNPFRDSLRSSQFSEGRFHVQQGYDFVFIDAGHLYVDAWLDILNAAPYAKPGAIIVVDDCSTDLYNRADNLILAEHNVYEFQVSMAWRHAVAIGIVEPMGGDVNGDADLCVGRYRMHQVDKYRMGFQI